MCIRYSLYDACEAMDIPADTTTSETGLGQFEVNLMHCDDALRAADDHAAAVRRCPGHCDRWAIDGRGCAERARFGVCREPQLSLIHI